MTPGLVQICFNRSRFAGTPTTAQKGLDTENSWQAAHQSLCLEGLAEKAGRPAGHRFFLDAGFGAGRDHDHRQRAVAQTELALEFKAVHARHLDVSDGTSELSKVDRCQEILG